MSIGKNAGHLCQEARLATPSLFACAFDQLKLHRGATMLQYSMVFEKQQKSVLQPDYPFRNIPIPVMLRK
jgi:hypothetical protein